MGSLNSVGKNISPYKHNFYPLSTLSDLTNVGNLLIFTERILDLRPKSVCAVEMTMCVGWTCINRNRKDVHA